MKQKPSELVRKYWGEVRCYKELDKKFISKEEARKELTKKVYIERRRICAKCSEDFKKMINEVLE